MMMTLLTIMLTGAMAPTGAGDVLANSPALALIEVTGPSRTTSDGRLTPVIRLNALAGDSAATMALVQRGARPHTLNLGERFVVSLRQDGDNWLYVGRTAQPMAVPNGQLRAAIAFVGRWRVRQRMVPFERLDEWVGGVRHPWAIARQISVARLRRHAPQLRGRLSRAQLEVLAAPLFDPGHDEATRKEALRLVGLLGGPMGVDLLAQGFDRVATAQLRHLVAGTIARHPTRTSRRTLLRCATEGGRLARRCQRLAARL